MTTVRLRGPETLTHVLRTPEIYLVPRGDGRIAIGATVEHAGFDKTVSPHAIASLLKAAAELFPPIAHAEILESWAGLRPGSSDELPLIGPTTDLGAPSCGISAGWESHSHTWIATGHFRNGILLAPGNARALSQLIRGETPAIDLAPFAPDRVPPAIVRPLDRIVPPASDNRSTAGL
jgi:glycine oxidase